MDHERQSVMPGSEVRVVWGPGTLSGADGVAESIASKDLNNLYRTSCYLRDKDRYRAFCAMYAVMRVIDDRVDQFLAQQRGTSPAPQVLDEVAGWHVAVRSCFSSRGRARPDLSRCNHPFASELVRALSQSVVAFPIPLILWEDFFSAMRRDLDGRGFQTFDDFLAYANGAAVAPTTMYLYLITAERREDQAGYTALPNLDVTRCGRALGRFAYLAHVLRDLRQDLSTGREGLCYLSANDMASYDVTMTSLRRDAAAEVASPPLRALVRDLAGRATRFAKEGRRCLATLDGRLGADQAFVLELIVRIYEAALAKIAACSFDVMSERHRLTSSEKKQIAIAIVEAPGVSAPTRDPPLAP